MRDFSPLLIGESSDRHVQPLPSRQSSISVPSSSGNLLIAMPVTTLNEKPISLISVPSSSGNLLIGYSARRGRL